MSLNSIHVKVTGCVRGDLGNALKVKVSMNKKQSRDRGAFINVSQCILHFAPQRYPLASSCVKTIAIFVE